MSISSSASRSTKTKGENGFDMCVAGKILTLGGAVVTTVGVSFGAAGGGPGLLAIGLGCILFVLGIFKDIKSELQIPVLVGWWKRSVPVEGGE